MFGAWGAWLALREAERQRATANYGARFPIANILMPTEYERFRTWLGQGEIGIGYVNPDPAAPQMQLAVGKPSSIAPRRVGQEILFSFEGKGTVLSAGTVFPSGQIELPQESSVYTGKSAFLQEIERLEPLVQSRRIAREPYEKFVRKVKESRFRFP